MYARVVSPSQPGEEAQLVDEIIAYLSEFPILLIIDNLETIDPALLRPLLVRIPPRSKVLFTSRIGIGELELRYPLGGLDEATATTLMRKYAGLLNLTVVSQASSATLASYSDRLFHNPLLIKWFVSAVAQGADPEAILSRRHPQLEAAIRFCFENLFERLSATERRVLDVLASCPRSVTHTELVYLLEGLDRHQIEWALNTLHRSSMLARTGDQADGVGVQYALTPIAAQFMTSCAATWKGSLCRCSSSAQ